MSKQVDERVVSMQFDNQHFESNVQTTMSTLDKLKQKLNLKGCAKAAESEFASYKTGVFSFRDTINKMWSTWEYDMANRLKNIAKNTLQMFTTQPVMTGFNEYELKMNSVQTIMASTGESIDTVNQYLNELNEYSDKTIYSFSDMTQNIGKFTNAGVKLEDAVKAIKGISNEAALSGANANEAARAMYNFSQALSAGYVKLIDWKSIENANMATVGFKEQLIESAVAAGTLTKEADGMYKTLDGTLINATKNFNESLQDQWMTSEVLITTLGKYADETTDIGKKATAAATEVKTFTMMMDTLKETAQSGWAQTWEIVFGDLIEAKKLWTGLTNFFGGIIDGFSDARNKLLKGALQFMEPWSVIMDKLDSSAGLSNLKKVTKSIDNVTEKLEHFQNVVKKVWRGDYGNVDTDPVGRFKLLEEAGYNAKVVQELVNLGKDHELTIEDVEAAHKKLGLTLEDSSEATEYISYALGNLTDEQLKNAGLTEDEIKLYKDLQKEADRLGISMDDLVDKMSKKDGRSLLIDSLKNAGLGIVKIFQQIKDAWLDIFPPMSVARLYTMIESLNTFSKKLVMSDETADKLKRTLKGVFAIVDILLTLTGGIIKPIIKAICNLLGLVDVDILSITANIGDAIVAVRDWIDAHNPLVKMFESIGNFIIKCIDKIKLWKDSLKDSKNLPKDLADGFINGIKFTYKSIKDAVVKLGENILNWFRDVLGIHSPSEETKSDGKNFVLGFIEGIKSLLITVKNFIVDTVKSILGWFSNGFTGGIADNIKTIFATIKTAFKKVTDWIKEHFREVKFDDILGIALGVGIIFIAKKLMDILSALTKPISLFGDFIDGLTDALVGLKKVFNALAFNIRMQGIKIFCESILILVAALVVLALVPADRLWPAIGALAVIIAIVAGLAVALGFMSKYSPGDFKGMAVSILGIGGALLALSASLALLTYIAKSSDEESLKKAQIILLSFAGFVVALFLLTKIGGNTVQQSGDVLKGIAKIISKFAWAFLLIAVAFKIAGSIKEENFTKAMSVFKTVSIMILALVGITKLPGGKTTMVAAAHMVKGLGTTLLLIAITMKIIAGMSTEELTKGISVIAILELLIIGLIAATKLAGKGADKIGPMISKIGWALVGIAIAVRILGGMSIEDLSKGIVAITAISGIIVGLMAATKLITSAKGIGPAKIKSVGTMLAQIAIGFLLISGSMMLLSYIKWEGLAKAVIGIAAIGGVFAVLIKMAEGVKDVKPTIIALTIAIVALTACIIALSFIDIKYLASATLALSMIIGVFALLLKATSYLNAGKKSFGKTLITLGVVTLVVGALATLVWLLSNTDPKNAIPSAIALSVLLIAISASLKILNKTKPVGMKTIANIAAMGIAVGILGGILWLLKKLDIDNSIGTVAALSILLITISGSLALLNKTNSVNWKTVGIVAVMGVILLGLGGILTLLKDLNPIQSLGMVAALSTLLLVMTGVLVILGVAGKFMSKALIGAAALAVLSGALFILGGLMIMLKDLNPQQSIGMAIALSALLLSMSAALVVLGVVGLFGASAFIGIAALAVLSAALFILGGLLIMLKDLNPEQSLGMVKALSTLLLSMSAALVILGVVGLLGPAAFVGIGALATLIVGIGALMVAIGALVKEFPQLEEFLDIGIPILKKIGTGLGEFFGSIIGGVFSGISGVLPGIGQDLSDFMVGAQPFIDGIKTVDQQAINGIKTFTEMITCLVGANILDKLQELFTGESAMTSFGKQLKGFASDIVAFSNTLTEGNFDGVAVEKAAIAGKLLAEMADTIPNMGGLIEWFTGKDDLGTFGSKLSTFASAIIQFSTAVSNGEINLEAIQKGKDATDILVDMANSIPNMGGMVSWFTGRDDLGTFGKSLSEFGSAITGYSKTVSKDGSINLEAISNSIKAADMLIDLSKRLPKKTRWYSKDQGLDDFGKEIKSFYDKIKNINSSKLEAIANAIVKVVDTIIAASKKSVNGFASNIESQYSRFLALGAGCVTKFANGLASVQAIVKVKVSLMVASIVNTIRGYYDSFYSAGTYVGTGFVSGVTSQSNMNRAYNAGWKLGAKAKQGAEDALDEASPSKEFYRIGAFAGKGFVNAFSDYESKSYNAGYDMADSARSGLSKAIRKVQAVIDSDIDTQPTIRPVLDLSDIESGAGVIGGMLGLRPSVGVLANVGSINSMMNSRQNGGNYDVISAIERLGKQMSGASGDTYNINGVTYDDGSNITDAVKTIVRAARIERRR